MRKAMIRRYLCTYVVLALDFKQAEIYVSLYNFNTNLQRKHA